MRFLADDTLKRRLSYLASQPHPTTTCRHQNPVIVLGPNLTDHPRTLIPEEPPPPHMALQAMASVAAAAAPVMMEAAVRAEEEAVAGEVEVVDDKYYSLDNGLDSFHHDDHACACSFPRPKTAYATDCQWDFLRFLGFYESLGFFFFF